MTNTCCFLYKDKNNIKKKNSCEKYRSTDPNRNPINLTQLDPPVFSCLIKSLCCECWT